MFVFGMVGVVLGYTLVYYGVSMWKYYNGASAASSTTDGTSVPGNSNGIPLTVLLGLTKLSNNTSGQLTATHPKLPFNLTGASAVTNNSAPAASSTTAPTTGAVSA
jgi:hypothetical protein